jgi:hypothetical protein
MSLLDRIGIGQVLGTPILPHAVEAPLHDAQAAMSDDPGLRLAGSRGKRVYRGGGLTLHQFAGPQGGMATDEVLATLSATRNQRRALGTFRGVPEAPPLTPPDPDPAG